MKRAAFLSAAVFVLVVAGRAVFAGHLPPVDPLVAGGDHSHENHSGHDHSGIIVPSIDLSFANLSAANFDAANLNQADLRNPVVAEAVTSDQLNRAADVTAVKLGGNDMSGFNLTSVNLTRADLSSANLSLVVLHGANLTETDLHSANLTSTSFFEANLTGADLRNPNVSEAITDAELRLADRVVGVNISENDLSGFDLRGLNFHGANLSSAMLNMANLSFVNFHSANFNSADLSSANLTGAEFSNADLSNADLRNVIVAEAIRDTQIKSAMNFAGVNLSGNDLSGFDLTDVDLRSANVNSVNFGSAILAGTDLRNTEVARAITDTQLQSAANVIGINLGGNDLSGFDLSGVNLTSANLSDANLSLADLSSANVSSTNLRSADLSNAIVATAELRFADFTGANLNGAVLGVATRFDGFVYEGTLNITSGTTTLNSLGFAGLGTLTTMDNDATLVAGNGVALGVGDNLVGNGHLDGKVAAGFGSIIQADGDLALGDTNAFDGFFSDGVLRTNDNTVTLHDRDKAVLGSLTELGNANGPGTLIAANGILVEAGKTLLGYGAVAGDLDNRGSLIPGASIGVLSVEGNYDQAVSGVLMVEIGGLDNSDPLNLQFDALHVMGAASLAGTLEVSVVDGFVPSTPLAVFGGDGDSVTVLTADSITGAFGTVDGLDYDNVAETGRLLRIEQTSNAVSLTAFQAAYGDTNLDCQINSTDLFNILGAGTFNNPVKWPTTWARGDFDDDGDVDSDDIFLILATGKFNGGPYSSAAVVVQAVPEPSTMVLAFAAFLGLVSIAARKGSAFAGRCS